MDARSRPPDPISATAHRIATRRLSRRGLLAGAGTIATLGISGCRGTAITSVEPAPIAAFSGLGDPPLLVDVSWLDQRLAGPDSSRLVLLDLSDLPTYQAGHIPGAVHVWWQDWIDPYSDIYGVLLGTRNVPTARVDGLRRLGIADDVTVVAYDADQNRYAARMVWMLRYFGHPQAAVLDGGLGAWEGAERSKTGDETEAQQRGAPTLTVDTTWTISFEEMTERYADPSLTILDVRTDGEAEDDLNGLLRHGTIPGAIRVPWRWTLRDQAGRLQPPDFLTPIYESAGVLPTAEIGVMARFGVEAAHTWLVLSLLGYDRVRLFDRGWAHWGRTDADRPIAPLPDVVAPT